MEFPHLLRLIAGEPVRHDLSRAFLLLLVARGRSRSSRAHGLARLRRRGAADPRRLAAHLRAATRATRRQPIAARVAALLGARARRRARTASTPTAPSPSRCSETKRAAARVPDRRASAPGKTRRRLRRAGQGQHAAQLLRHPHATSSTTRSIAARTSRARFLPGTHIPIYAPGDASARRGPTTC